MAPLEVVLLKRAILKEMFLEALVLGEAFPKEKAQEEHLGGVVVLEEAMLEALKAQEGVP